MTFGWNYPPGAETDPRAPWNERQAAKDEPPDGDESREADALELWRENRRMT